MFLTFEEVFQIIDSDAERIFYGEYRKHELTLRKALLHSNRFRESFVTYCQESFHRQFKNSGAGGFPLSFHFDSKLKLYIDNHAGQLSVNYNGGAPTKELLTFIHDLTNISVDRISGDYKKTLESLSFPWLYFLLSVNNKERYYLSLANKSLELLKSESMDGKGISKFHPSVNVSEFSSNLIFYSFNERKKYFRHFNFELNTQSCGDVKGLLKFFKHTPERKTCLTPFSLATPFDSYTLRLRFNVMSWFSLEKDLSDVCWDELAGKDVYYLLSPCKGYTNADIIGQAEQVARKIQEVGCKSVCFISFLSSYSKTETYFPPNEQFSIVTLEELLEEVTATTPLCIPKLNYEVLTLNNISNKRLFMTPIISVGSVTVIYGDKVTDLSLFNLFLCRSLCTGKELLPGWKSEKQILLSVSYIDHHPHPVVNDVFESLRREIARNNGIFLTSIPKEDFDSLALDFTTLSDIRKYYKRIEISLSNSLSEVIFIDHGILEKKLANISALNELFFAAKNTGKTIVFVLSETVGKPFLSKLKKHLNYDNLIEIKHIETDSHLSDEMSVSIIKSLNKIKVDDQKFTCKLAQTSDGYNLVRSRPTEKEWPTELLPKSYDLVNKKIRAFRENGAKIKAIAERLNMKESTVKKRLGEMGLTKKRKVSQKIINTILGYE